MRVAMETMSLRRTGESMTVYITCGVGAWTVWRTRASPATGPGVVESVSTQGRNGAHEEDHTCLDRLRVHSFRRCGHA